MPGKEISVFSERWLRGKEERSITHVPDLSPKNRSCPNPNAFPTRGNKWCAADMPMAPVKRMAAVGRRIYHMTKVSHSFLKYMQSSRKVSNHLQSRETLCVCFAYRWSWWRRYILRDISDHLRKKATRCQPRRQHTSTRQQPVT